MFASKEWVKDLLTKVLRTKKDSLTPIGTVISFMGNTAPEGYFICDGSEYNIADYPEFVQYLQDQFGSVSYFGGNGETTFRVPDLRGEFLRGAGTGTRDTGTGAAVGQHQDATQHNRTLYTTVQLQHYYDTGSADSNGATTVINQDKAIPSKGTMSVRVVNLTGSNTSSKTAKYTSRPTNTSVLYCIKY